MSPSPYYQDGLVTLYNADFRDVIDGIEWADLVVTDPPYGETSLEWDLWPDGWPAALAASSSSMWCFGSMRMFLDRGADFADWKFSQDIVWEKQNGSGFASDRFKRVHEHANFWYRGAWSDVYHAAQTTPDATARAVRRRLQPPHTGSINASAYVSQEGGPRLARSVIYSPNMHGRAINETEKPVGLLETLIAYGAPGGGLVLDPFAGSCSTLAAARNIGRRSIGIERREAQCEKAALRLSAQTFDFTEVAEA